MRRQLVAWVLLAGCAPRVRLQVLEPADITLPREIRALAVVDRSGSPTAVEVLDGLTRALDESPRFEPVRAGAPDTPGPDPLGPEVVAGLVAAADAQAVVALEALSHESRVIVDTLVEERVEHVGPSERTTVLPVYDARRESKVITSWRVYQADGAVLDQLDDVMSIEVWSAQGPTREEAAGALPGEDQTIAELGGSAGWAYGRRIAPTLTDATREYYVAGDPRLRSARRAVRAGDWAAAMAVWRDVASTARRPEIRARAEHDLAVGHEVLGQYRPALQHAEEAVALDGAPRMVRYRDLLVDLRAQQRLLRRQMAPADGEG